MSYDPSADRLRITEAVEKAPSVFNTRPWVLRFPAADRIELRLPHLGDLDHAQAREYTISCGAALFNLRLAIRVAGYELAVWERPDPGHDSTLLASVEVITGWIKKPIIEEQELYEAIWHRHTNQLMALSTDDDRPLDWLRAGQALQRAILAGTRYSASAPYGLTALYHAPPKYGLPARRHLLTRHDELAHYGLSVSFLTQPLERDDICAKPRHWPWRWRFPELPQMVVRVGYAAWLCG